MSRDKLGGVHRLLETWDEAWDGPWSEPGGELFGGGLFEAMDELETRAALVIDPEDPETAVAAAKLIERRLVGVLQGNWKRRGQRVLDDVWPEQDQATEDIGDYLKLIAYPYLAYRLGVGMGGHYAIQESLRSSIRQAWDVGRLTIGGPFASNVHAPASLWLQQYTGYWITTHVERRVIPEISARAMEIMAGAKGRQEAIGLMRSSFRAEFERSDAYWELLVNNAVTQARTWGAYASAASMGKEYLGWVTAGDERVCERCAAMHGVRFPVDRGLKHYGDIMAAKEPEDVRFIDPWVGYDKGHGDKPFYIQRENRRLYFGPEQLQDGDWLIDHGIAGPPLHWVCRCSLQLISG